VVAPYNLYTIKTHTTSLLLAAALGATKAATTAKILRVFY
jgi:hypothetical protein